MNSPLISDKEIRYAAIDFETAYWGPGSACSLGIVVSNGKEVVDEWYHLIRPYSLHFDKNCMKVNGIRPEDVEGEETFPAFLEDIAERLEGTVVFAHNARFDMGVLAQALSLYGLPSIRFLYGDTVPLSRALWKDLENHKLNTVADALGFDFHHHRALDDARACEYIVRKALEETGAESIEMLMKNTGQELKKFTRALGRPKAKRVRNKSYGMIVPAGQIIGEAGQKK